MLSLHCHPAGEACPGQRCSWQGQGASCCCSRIPGPRNAQGGSPGVGRGEWPEGDEQGWAAAKPPAPALRIQDRPVLGTGKTPHLREMFKSFHGKSLTTPSLLSQPGTGKGSSASSMLNPLTPMARLELPPAGLFQLYPWVCHFYVLCKGLCPL